MTDSPKLSLPARLLRLAVVAGLLYVMAQTMVEAQSRPATPASEDAASSETMTREEAMNAPDAIHGSYDRPPEEAVQATRKLQQVMKSRELADDEIDFDLLRDTRLPSKPPPVFNEDLAVKDGQEIRIIGFMSPYNSLRDMRNFMLMPNATGCYFCIPPSPREVVFVRMAPQDDALPFVNDPIEVTGTLNLWKEGSEEAAHRMFLFAIDDAKIRAIDLEEVLASREKSAPAGERPLSPPSDE